MSYHEPQILVADDNPDTRAILQGRLERAGYRVVLAGDGQRALQAAARCRIDLALIDVVMPGPAGAALARALKERHPQMEAILITAYGSIEDAVESMHLGAFYYLSKPINWERLAAIVEEALAGRRTPGGKTVGEGDLSGRECGVLDALVEGMTDQEIADVLEISVYTVHTHVRNILSKLQLRNRVQAALWWDRCTRQGRSRHQD